MLVLPNRFRNIEYAVIIMIVGKFSKSIWRWMVESNLNVRCLENVKEVKELMTLFLHSFAHVKKASYLRKELVSVFCF